MTPANKNLFLRVVSSVVLLPVVIALLWAGPVWTAGLIAAAAALLVLEFYAMTLQRRDLPQVVGILVSAALPLVWALWPERFAAIALALLVGLVLASFTGYLLAGPLKEAPTRVAMVCTGALYCGVLLSTISGLRQLPHGLSWVFLLLVVTWANDTGAYGAGRAFGKHKLYPAVSPAKTWEGFVGGMVASVAGALICSATFFPDLSVGHALLVAIPASILGPIGDLSESMLKRAYGVKDSGNLMPGHGGLLDRVDAVLFNAPYVFLIALVLGP